MADLNLSLEIVGSTSKAVDELGRTKAAVDQVGQAFAKEADQAVLAGQAIQRQAQQVTSTQQRLAEAANTILRTSVGQGGVTAGNLESLRGQIQKQLGVAPTLSATDLGLPVSASDLGRQAQAARADQVARARTVSVQNHPARAGGPPAGRASPPDDVEPPGDSGRGGALNFLERGQGPLRFVAGLAGIGLGLNVAAEAAKKIHDEIAASVDAERALELGARSVAAVYGAASKAIEVAASAFAQDPTTRGTQTQALQAASSMAVLTQEYGLNAAQVQQLTTAAGQLARIHGVELPAAVGALKGVMQGNTAAANAFGVSVTDQLGRIRGLGASYEQLVQIYGRAHAEQLLLGVTLDQVRIQQGNTRGQTDQLATAMDRLAKSSANARTVMAGWVADPGTIIANWVADRLSAAPPGVPDRHAIVAPPTPVTDQQAALDARNEQLKRDFKMDLPGPTAGQTQYGRLITEIDQALASLKRLSDEQSKFNTLAKSAEGVDFPHRLEAGQAAQIGALRAAQDLDAERARKVAVDKANLERGQLVQSVQFAQRDFGPNSDNANRAQIELGYFDQRAAGQSKLVEAQHEQVNAELALSVARRQDLDNVQAMANAQAEITGHAQEQRDIAHELNSIDDQRVQVNRELAVLQARQNALPAGRRVQDLQREEALLLAQAHLHPDQRADVAGRLRDISLHGMPEAQYADLVAQGPVIAAQRAQEDADIARQIRLSPTRARQIDLEALLQPVRDKAARLAEAQELVRLGATPQEVRAEMARRAAEDAQKALVTIPSPSAAATAAGVGAGGTSAGPQTFQITVYANGTVEGAGGPYGEAAQKGGAAFSAAFREQLATRGTPPVRSMLGGADNLLTP